MFFQKNDGNYVIGRVGQNESFIERNFLGTITQTNSSWFAPISIYSGKSYGFLCQICGDVSWFRNNVFKFNYPSVNIVDNRIQQCRKGGSMY